MGPLPPVVDDTPPRSAPRRRLSTRETPPNVKRGSLFGGIFGRSKPEATPPAAKPSRSSRARANTLEATPVKSSRREPEPERPSSRDMSSDQSRERPERMHRSRRVSHSQRRFASAEEEADYYRWKEERRFMRRPEHEMSGGRDGGVSLPPPPPPPEDLPPPPPEPFEYEPEPEPIETIESPVIEDAAAVVGEISISDEERRERRRSRRMSKPEERPKTRRISVVEKERPSGGRRVESDRPRARDHGEDRPRPRRGETDRRDRRKKKEESSGQRTLRGIEEANHLSLEYNRNTHLHLGRGFHTDNTGVLAWSNCSIPLTDLLLHFNH